MTPLDKLLTKLPKASKAGKNWLARCPAHDDQRPSLSIGQGDDGVGLVKCNAGCETNAILAAVGLEPRDLFPTKTVPTQDRNDRASARGRTFPNPFDAVETLERQLGKRSELWNYHDAHGEPIGVVVCWDGPNGKNIRPVARHSDGWRIGAMPEPRPLYSLPAIAQARRILVVEGEKAATAALALGLIATTSAGGAQAAGKTDWGPLAEKEVWIFPDNDSPGRKYAETVAGILGKLTPAPVVRIVELPNLPDGGDLVDWIEAHGDAADQENMAKEIESLALAVEPLGPAGREELAYRPFPVGALPAPIRGFVDAGARAINCDPSYLGLPLLTAIAAAIGNTRNLELKTGWLAPPILWGAIVGESGTAKTPAFKLVMRPIRARQSKALKRHGEEMKQYESEMAEWGKAFAAWKGTKNSDDDLPEKPTPPISERFIVSDTTVEALVPILQENPRGLLLTRDELSGWIGSFDRYAGKGKGGGDSANWLSMFNAETVTVDRKTGNPRTIHVPQAAVWVTGGIQPGIFKRVLGQEHRESGLAARLLLAWPPRMAKCWTDDDIDPGMESKLANLIDRLYELKTEIGKDGEPRPALVKLSSGAKAKWVAYYNAHGLEQANLTGDLAAAWSKLEEYAARLALVVHFIRWAACDPTLLDPAVLDEHSINTGIVLCNWFKHEARRIYAMLDESDAEGDQRRLVEWIGRKGGKTTPREVQQGCRWLKEPGKAETALGDLVKVGLGIWRDVPTTAKGGRPARVFVLPTPSTVNETTVLPEKKRVL